MKRLLSFIIVLTLVFGATMAVSASESTAYNAVKSSYGKKFPLKSKNAIKTARKNIFGKYSTVLGVSAKNFKSYKAARKSNGKSEYICAIFKATKKAKVKTIKASLNKYVAKEKSSGRNYFSKKGKSLLAKAKVGSKGNYVYLFVLDTKGNSKAIKAFKRAA